jgi:hypothetical protein
MNTKAGCTSGSSVVAELVHPAYPECNEGSGREGHPPLQFRTPAANLGAKREGQQHSVCHVGPPGQVAMHHLRSDVTCPDSRPDHPDTRREAAWSGAGVGMVGATWQLSALIRVIRG